MLDAVHVGVCVDVALRMAVGAELIGSGPVLVQPDLSRVNCTFLVDEIEKRLEAALAFEPSQVTRSELVLRDHVLWQGLATEGDILPLGEDSWL